MADDITSILGISSSSTEPARTTPAKGQYMKRIREQSAYPVFRSFLGLSQTVVNVVSLFLMIGGLFFGVATGGWPGIAMAAEYFITGLVFALVGRVTIEASSMLADIADSITDLNCRYESPDQ